MRSVDRLPPTCALAGDWTPAFCCAGPPCGRLRPARPLRVVPTAVSLVTVGVLLERCPFGCFALFNWFVILLLSCHSSCVLGKSPLSNISLLSLQFPVTLYFKLNVFLKAFSETREHMERWCLLAGLCQRWLWSQHCGTVCLESLGSFGETGEITRVSVTPHHCLWISS